MWSLSRFSEKVRVMAEGGSHYCSKKTDDICGDGCNEVLTVVQKFSQRANSQCISDEAKKEMDDMLVQANESSLPKAPWDEGVYKVCGVDRDDDDSVPLYDTCDSEYHTYCLCPPLPRILEGNWCCPSCVAGQLKSQGDLQFVTLERYMRGCCRRDCCIKRS